jgi:hypothetical protein
VIERVKVAERDGTGFLTCETVLVSEWEAVDESVCDSLLGSRRDGVLVLVTEKLLEWSRPVREPVLEMEEDHVWVNVSVWVIVDEREADGLWSESVLVGVDVLWWGNEAVGVGVAKVLRLTLRVIVSETSTSVGVWVALPVESGVGVCDPECVRLGDGVPDWLQLTAEEAVQEALAVQVGDCDALAVGVPEGTGESEAESVGVVERECRRRAVSVEVLVREVIWVIEEMVHVGDRVALCAS